MRITCPSCAAAYNVPESLLGADARPVRCARCGTEWVPEPAEPPRAAVPPTVAEEPGTTLPTSLAEAEVGEAVPAEPDPARVPVAPPPPDGRLAMFAPLAGTPERPAEQTAARVGWAVSAVVIVLMLGAGYFWRAQVQAAWPPIQRAYAALGLR